MSIPSQIRNQQYFNGVCPGYEIRFNGHPAGPGRGVYESGMHTGGSALHGDPSLPSVFLIHRRRARSGFGIPNRRLQPCKTMLAR